MFRYTDHIHLFKYNITNPSLQFSSDAEVLTVSTILASVDTGDVQTNRITRNDEDNTMKFFTRSSML